MEPDGAALRPASGGAYRPRVLVADDEEPILRLLEMKFVRAGFDVVTAIDGRQAWEKVLQQPFDLVLTDYRMADIDGLELCGKLLMHPRTRHIPVLVMTSPWCKIGDQLQQFDNVVELIEKPLDVRELIAKVRRLVAAAPPARSGPASSGAAEGQG